MARFLESLRTGRKKVLNGIRVKPNKGKSYDADIDPDDELISILGDDDATMAQMLGIQQFREISKNRGEQYDAFDEMEKDATISAALKMYADDATQYNLDGDVIWVESDNPDIAKFGNRLIDILNINRDAWVHIYNLVKYGDVYLETFYDDEDIGLTKANDKRFGTAVLEHRPGARIDEYIEMVADPASIFDLRHKGKVSGFIKLSDFNAEKTNYSRAFSVSLVGTEQQILPSDKYVHISLAEVSNRFPETFEVEYSDGNGEPVIQSFKVAKGKSLLEDVFKSFRELKLMEDSILLNRVTRSALTRILQVEVGDLPKPQVREKLRKVKQMIEQKNFLDKSNGEFSNMASPGPVDNVVYVPTRQGVGAITATTLGGDVDPKSLIDIEYYKQKEAGALQIPLAYLQAQSGDGGGLSSGTALTKLDNRYARTIKRIQTAYCSGIQTLINIFAIRKGMTDYVNAFKVRMLSPSTIEDADRDEQLDNRVRMAGDLISLISQDEEMYSRETRREIIEYLVSTFLNKPEIAEKLQVDEQQPAPEEDSQEEGFDDFGGDDFGSDFSSGGGGGFDDFGGGVDTGGDFEASEESFDNVIDSGFDNALDLEAPASPSGDDTGFGDFEDFA